MLHKHCCILSLVLAPIGSLRSCQTAASAESASRYCCLETLAMSVVLKILPWRYPTIQSLYKAYPAIKILYSLCSFVSKSFSPENRSQKLVDSKSRVSSDCLYLRRRRARGFTRDRLPSAISDFSRIRQMMPLYYRGLFMLIFSI